MPDVELLVDISDTHVLSTVGLQPPDFVTLEGNTIGQNLVQKWLWDKWSYVHDVWIPAIVGDSPYALLLNGDLVDGIHHRTVQVASLDEQDQSRACLEIFEPIAKKAHKTYLSLGTEVHVKTYEHALGKVIGAESDPANPQRHAFDKVKIKIKGCNVSAAHHISATTRPNLEGTQLSNALNLERTEANRCGHEVPQVVLRAHRHTHGEFCDGMGMCIVTGGWQLTTRYVSKIAAHSISRPSVVILDWRNVDYGELPLVHRKIFIPECEGFKEP